MNPPPISNYTNSLKPSLVLHFPMATSQVAAANTIIALHTLATTIRTQPSLEYALATLTLHKASLK